MTSATKVNAGLATVSMTTAFPTGSSLASQLKTVAQMIGARNALGAKRQVFMVSLGGFDLHDYLNTRHAPLLQQLDQALTAFYQATVELGVGTDPLFSRYTTTTGVSVVKVDGTYTTVPYPWLGTIADLTEGVDYFLGGHIYEVSESVASALAADGYETT